jgi:hypothetical protein
MPQSNILTNNNTAPVTPAKSWFAIARSKRIVTRAFKTCLVVGTILNLINQWQGILGPEPIRWFTLCLTFLTPLLVSIFAGTCSAQHYEQLMEADRQKKQSGSTD